MGDSDLSASELRKRYVDKNGLPDDQLSASQIRARNAIPGNRKDFSTRENAVPVGGLSLVVIAAIILVGLAVIAYAIVASSKSSSA